MTDPASNLNAPNAPNAPNASTRPFEAAGAPSTDGPGPDAANAARFSIGSWLAQSLLIAPILGVLIGSACALFLTLLDRVTLLRWQHPWLLWLLPAFGVLTALLYRPFGEPAARGTPLVIESLAEPQNPSAGEATPGKPAVPWVMAPLVLLGTLLTHLGGGSAGREGTAVQMGGGIASGVSSLLGRWRNARRLDRSGLGADASFVRTLLLTGVACGFAGVFGTPWAGVVFALEVAPVGRLRLSAALPCVIGALVADRICGWWGVVHTQYPALGSHALALNSAASWSLLGKVLVAAVCFGLVARVFVELLHFASAWLKRWVKSGLLRPIIGGALVMGAAAILGTTDYLGLGVTSPDPSAVTILSAFAPGGAEPLSFAAKLLLTVLTLCAGFKGGEVTPLFFIGATLGNTLAKLLAAPTALFAGLGFVGVFAGATAAPLACTVMAVELFGPEHGTFFAITCFAARYAAAGHAGRRTVYAEPATHRKT